MGRYLTAGQYNIAPEYVCGLVAGDRYITIYIIIVMCCSTLFQVVVIYIFKISCFAYIMTRPTLHKAIFHTILDS